MTAIMGRTQWAFAAGHMPDGSTGREPEFTSRDELCLLNTSTQEACAEVTVFHADKDPVGPYRIEVAAQRVRHIRINDLVDPEAIPLGEPYGLSVTSDVPLVIQMRHLDTRQAELGVALSSGLPGDS
ncbi:MAG: sensory rhodopsin transducer [Corynebacterium sp.]|uniref:sensory rhodopsin transducer n=1 Tax=Corynebacterium sp. TaxID=1720 RepID=UPI0026DF9C7E|nr:sensory rhodopsin transducer [Corynebacterium sp.]MDO5670223.1 sensory rhodopsin transducer [Corynebacterium sp.]